MNVGIVHCTIDWECVAGTINSRIRSLLQSIARKLHHYWPRLSFGVLKKRPGHEYRIMMPIMGVYCEDGYYHWIIQWLDNNTNRFRPKMGHGNPGLVGVFELHTYIHIYSYIYWTESGFSVLLQGVDPSKNNNIFHAVKKRIISLFFCNLFFAWFTVCLVKREM